MKQPSLQPAESRWPHRLALLLACATFPLLWVGGLVTSYDAGMAVPDWPTTYGYNLFLYPWQTWVLGPWDLFIEHGHRLFAAAVGMLTIALLAAIGLRERRKWVWYAALGALALVCIQGVLGGMRVQLGERTLARIHGCVGPLFFGYAAALVAFTSKWWASATARIDSRAAGLHRLAIATAAVAYVQLVLGACIRHRPDGMTAGQFRLIGMFHFIMAGVLALHVALVAARIVRHFRDERILLRPALILCGLLIVQIGLGLATWVTNYGVPAWFSGYSWAANYTVEAKSPLQIHVTTAHVAFGSLIFAISITLVLRSLRLAHVEPHPSPAGGKLIGVAA
ncbi:MAG TPA: COX15/CtaA family protein [Pirellulales bacterium]|nr:COX15/CtaA family protein [Pirellulales bacterium]